MARESLDLIGSRPLGPTGKLVKNPTIYAGFFISLADGLIFFQDGFFGR